MSGRVKIKSKDKDKKHLLDIVIAEEDLDLMKYVSKHDFSFVPKI